jgi:PAS domain S-box-containing protein
MSLQPALVRALLRSAALALLPLTGLAAWVLYDAVAQLMRLAPADALWWRAGLLLGCVLLAAWALRWVSHLLIRGGSRRLTRWARQPEEGAHIGAHMTAGELVEATRLIATEQQHAQALSEELRQNAARLEEVQRAASIGSWRADLASGRVEWSAQTYAIFGVPAGETMTLERRFGLAHPQDRAGLVAQHAALAAGSADMDLAYRVVRANGEERVVHERGTVATRAGDGRPSALVGTVQDVTEAWESAGLSDALARALALSGNPVLLTSEHAGAWIRVWSNPAWDQLCKELELDGREAESQLFDPNAGLLRGHVADAREARAEQRALRLDLSVVTPDGPRWYEAELIPQAGAPGRSGHGLLLLRDRSAERRAALTLQEANLQLEATVAQGTAELARSERLYGVLATLSPQIVWQADGDAGATYLNRAWYELVGAREGDWLGPRWLDALHPDDIAASRAAFAAAAQAQQPLRVRRRIRSRHGGYRSFLGVAAPVRGSDDGIECWVGVDTDITELERHASRLHELNAELETFSYTVSHDLRAPVQVIKGFVEALLSGQVGEVDAAARSCLERVLRNARRMDELIADLLALARLSRETLRASRFDPAVLARSVTELIQERYPGRVIECLASGGGIEIEADRRLFQVLLENLLDNAAKFTNGRAVCRIDVTVRRERDETVIEVADRGVGFPVELAHRLFRPYQRLHAAADFQGHGIGLATVARIVQLHGGRISGHNRDGGGARFEIRLPLQPLAALQPVATPEMT